MHSIFSLGVEAPFALVPGWPAEPRPAGLQIRHNRSLKPVDPHRHYCRREAAGRMRYNWPGTAEFIIRPEQVEILPADQPHPRALRELILGPVLGCAMELRGMAVLHGASLALPGGAGGCLLLGESGTGKSTLSSHVLAAGGRLLNEDISVITQAAGAFLLEPGWPVMRLQEARGRALGLQACADITVTGGDKLAYRVPPERFCGEPPPLRRAFILGRGANACERLAAGQALAALLEQVYTRRLMDTALLEQYFTCCTALLQRVPVYRLTSEAGEAGKAWALERILGGSGG